MRSVECTSKWHTTWHNLIVDFFVTVISIASLHEVSHSSCSKHFCHSMVFEKFHKRSHFLVFKWKDTFSEKSFILRQQNKCGAWQKQLFSLYFLLLTFTSISKRCRFVWGALRKTIPFCLFWIFIQIYLTVYTHTHTQLVYMFTSEAATASTNKKQKNTSREKKTIFCTVYFRKRIFVYACFLFSSMYTQQWQTYTVKLHHCTLLLTNENRFIYCYSLSYIQR